MKVRHHADPFKNAILMGYGLVWLYLCAHGLVSLYLLGGLLCEASWPYVVAVKGATDAAIEWVALTLG